MLLVMLLCLTTGPEKYSKKYELKARARINLSFFKLISPGICYSDENPIYQIKNGHYMYLHRYLLKSKAKQNKHRNAQKSMQRAQHH